MKAFLFYVLFHRTKDAWVFMDRIATIKICCFKDLKKSKKKLTDIEFLGFQGYCEKWLSGCWMVVVFVRILVMIDNAYQSTSDTNLAVIVEFRNRKTA